MAIELITISRLQEAYTIYNDCRTALRANNVLQWLDGYPSIETTQEDINNNELYGFISNNECLGLITLNQVQEPQYQQINWAITKGSALVIHRLAVSPRAQKQGIATKLMDFAEDFAAQQGYTSIRLDSYSVNKVSVAFYLNRNYKKMGEVYFKDREQPFFCFEKEITPL